MMHLFLEAIDVWLFRDGRPFDARSNHLAQSLFPPFPSVMQGAIRSHHLVVKGVDLRDAQKIASTVGTADDYKTLRIRGPFLAKRHDNGSISRYLPIPAHAVPDDDGYRALSPEPVPGTVKTSAPTPMLLWSKSEPQKGDLCRWVREDQLQGFSRRTLQLLRGEPDGEFFAGESRIGIGRNDDRRTTEEGALFEVEFIRPKRNVGLLVEVQGYDGWPPSGAMRIGGEGRGARFTQVNASAWPMPPNPFPQRFMVYFATPTYFAAGWQPHDWGTFFEGGVRLQAAALNRFQSLGGFDWAKNDHKPSRRYVPAGAVYFFESDGEARLKDNLIQDAVTDAGAEIGFGQILIKEW